MALAIALLAGCRDDRVVVAYRPPLGRTYLYDTTVSTTTTVELQGRAPEPPQTEVVELRAEQLVLPSATSDETRVQILLTRPGAATRTYIARFDRAAQLTDIERVEGIPTEALGELGLTEIFPAAAGAPPARGLQPGDTWAIDEAVRLPDATQPGALTGQGRLAELGVIDGHRTARVKSSTALPLTTTVSSSNGTQRLDGTQTTDLDAAYDVSDGSVVSGTAVSVGRFAIVLSPPPGQRGDPLTGRLTVEVRTTIQRR
ncbi:MAG: hypothetical protein ABIV94_02985 [Acidimicrobiales bacterium]